MDNQLIALLLAGLWGRLLLCAFERRWFDIAVSGLAVAIVVLAAIAPVSVCLPLFLAGLFLLGRRRIIDWVLLASGLLILYTCLKTGNLLWGWFFVWEGAFFLLNSKRQDLLFVYSLLTIALSHLYHPFFMDKEFFLWSSFILVLSGWQSLSSPDRVWYRYGFVNLLRVLLVALSPVGRLGQIFAFGGMAILPFIFDGQLKKENKMIEGKSIVIIVVYLLLSLLLGLAIFLSFESRPVLFLSGRQAIDWAIFLSLMLWILVLKDLIFSCLSGLFGNGKISLLWAVGLSLLAFYFVSPFLAYFLLLISGLLLIGLFVSRRIQYFYFYQLGLPETFNIARGIYAWLLKISLGYRVALGLLKNWLVRVLLYILLGSGLVYYVWRLG